MIVAGHELEVVRIDGGAPTLVFLHEGLGSVSAWRDFPARVAARTKLAALVHSRWGYGQSEPVTLPRPLTYMHDEARALPELLEAARIESAILVGHSDGASIALLAAGDPRIRGLVLFAPHVFVEDVSVASIEAARTAYETTDLRSKLARHHRDVDGAFWGWNRAWLDPAFRAWNIESCLPRVRVPTLLVQGREDPYGTLAQLDAIARGVTAPVTRLVLDHCGHAPHRDHPEVCLDAIAQFVSPLRG